MDNELLTQILRELHEIKSDIRWFKEREEEKLKASKEIVEDAAKRLLGESPKT